MIELKHIPQQDISKWWDTIKPGVEKVRAHGLDGWREEDMYMALKQGGSQLHVGLRDKYYKGFIVTTALPGFSGPVLHIWAVYIDSKDDEIAQFWDVFNDMAKNTGFVRMTFHSPRKGWERRLAKYGMSPEQIIFSKEV